MCTGIVMLIIILGRIRKSRLLKERTVTPSEALEAWQKGEFLLMYEHRRNMLKDIFKGHC